MDIPYLGMMHDTTSYTSSKVRFRAETAARLIYDQLSNRTRSSTSELTPCGNELIDQLRRASDPLTELNEARYLLDYLESFSESIVKSESTKSRYVPLHSRRLYTDCRLLHSLLDLRDPNLNDLAEQEWEKSVNRLDMAIVIAGAPGEGRLDLILDTIELIQAGHLPLRAEGFTDSLKSYSPLVNIEYTASNKVPRIPPPSVGTFRSNTDHPFILSRFISDWPALTDHPWASLTYLLHVAGRGRMVPVEVGSDYRAEEWSQKMMPWEAFLRAIGMNPDLCDSEKTDSKDDKRPSDPKQGVLYLAQHTLLTQFPALRSDIIVPDYIYSSPSPPPTCPSYRPPSNDEQLVINAWLGPKGTLSPAHMDPYFNCYAQVVGRKTVWLAPPRFQTEMYPYTNPNAPHTTHNTAYSLPADKSPADVPDTIPSLSNTSRVDVFSPPSSHTATFPLFESIVRPHSLCAVLQPGDLLYIPPGWWHAMRSEDVSFSVSMWF